MELITHFLVTGSDVYCWRNCLTLLLTQEGHVESLEEEVLWFNIKRLTEQLKKTKV